MSLKKPNLEDLFSENADEKNAVSKFLNTSNPWLREEFLKDIERPIHMEDEELIYITNIMNNLKTIGQQRAMIDFIHIKCDSDTISRFMGLFPEETISKMMLTC